MPGPRRTHIYRVTRTIWPNWIDRITSKHSTTLSIPPRAEECQQTIRFRTANNNCDGPSTKILLILHSFVHCDENSESKPFGEQHPRGSPAKPETERACPETRVYHRGCLHLNYDSLVAIHFLFWPFFQFLVYRPVDGDPLQATLSQHRR